MSTSRDRDDVVDTKKELSETAVEEETSATTTAKIVEKAELSDSLIILRPTRTGYTVFQYSLDSDEIHHVADFDASRGDPNILDSLTEAPLFSFQRQSFDSHFERMAVCWQIKAGKEYHVGWVDRDGNITDISEELHASTSDFESKSPQDMQALFDSQDRLVFYDTNENVYCCYDLKTRKIVDTYPHEDVSMQRGEYALDSHDLPFRDELMCKENIILPTGYYYTYGDALVETSNGTILLYVYENQICKTGAGVVEVEEYEGQKYYDCITNYGLTYAGEPITPESEWNIRSIAYADNTIYFLAIRDKELALFKMSFVDGVAGKPEYVRDMGCIVDEQLKDHFYYLSYFLFRDDRDIMIRLGDKVEDNALEEGE